MGIFASRSIRKDEELTFNYNVDRYGHEAQPCYCGEPNCVGFLGGKTQTDLGGMDTLFLDALGITDEVEVLGLKGSKKKKGKKLDEDYVPVLHPFTEKEAPKLVQAVRQTTSRKVLVKLLTRIGITEDVGALRQLMRLRMFSVMTNVLEDYREDAEICVVAMDAMRKWPLLVRNKVEDSKVNVPVQAFADSSTDEKLKAAAQQVGSLCFPHKYAHARFSLSRIGPPSRRPTASRSESSKKATNPPRHPSLAGLKSDMPNDKGKPHHVH
jgi:hypothetical protein